MGQGAYFAIQQSDRPRGPGPRRGGGIRGRVGTLNKLGIEVGHLQDLPQLLSTKQGLGFWLNRALCGDSYGPRQRVSSLRKEENNTRTIDSASPLVLLAQQPVFALAAWAQMMQGWWAWSHQRGAT